MATQTAKAENFVWTDKEVELLFQTTLNFKATKAQQAWTGSLLLKAQ